MMLNILSVVLVALLGTVDALGNATADNVTDISSLPGWPKTLDFEMYSGYIDIKNTTKRIHYVFVEAMQNKSTAPTVIWFNGGPGCSSMLGLLQETGPYVLMDGDTNYTKNPHSWNNETNMLYIEQPAGVGYSTCDNLTAPEDCVHNDTSSALDNLQVLLGFFEKFSDKPYKANPVYIAGESYAGIYVPLLSYYLHNHNQNQTNDADKINLKGFMVGNGVTNWTFDTANATMDVAYYRMLVPQTLKDQIKEKQCNFSGVGMSDFAYLSEECEPLLDQMYNAFDGIDIYNIYGKCWYWNGTNTTNFTTTDVRNQLYGQYKSKSGKVHEYQKFWSAQEYTPWVKPFVGASNDYGIPGCIYALPAAEHLNNETVRAALNIETDQPWRMCANRNSTFSYSKSASASQWAYELLRDSPLRMMHFSGDMDASVPTIGTERWFNRLGWNTTSPWMAHMTADDNVGGYYQVLEGDLTLITIHGAGHMVPQDQREIAYNQLFDWVFQRGNYKQPDEQKPEEQKPAFMQQ